MKRRDFLASAALGGVATLATPTVAQTSPALRWRLAIAFPKALDLVQASAQLFAKTVSDATDGRFQIDIVADGDGQDGGRAIDAVAAGTLDAALAASSQSIAKDPTFGLLTGAPFSLNARQQNAWLYEGGGLALANAFYAKHALYALPGGNTGAQMGGWFRRELKSAADLAGLKMRLDGLGAAVMQKLGADPQVVAPAEIAASLERGTLDAAEWVGPYDDEKLGLGKAAPFYYYPGWFEGASSYSYLVNLEKWTALPKPYRAVVEAAAAFSNIEMTAKYDARNPGALRRLLGAGTQLRPFGQDILEAAYKASGEVYDEISGRNADFKTIWDSMRAFRAEEYLWFQVAEYPFDNFMIRARAKGG